MPDKIVVFASQHIEIIDVKHLALAACAVPKAHFAFGLEPSQLIEDMRTHRCHTGATANKDHLVIGFLSEELAERSGYRNLIPCFQIKDIG